MVRPSAARPQSSSSAPSDSPPLATLRTRLRRGPRVGELLLMTVCVVVGLPTPLLAIHLLWINLVTDGLPALERIELRVATANGCGSCDRCKGSGYKGRVGIYQVMPISDEMSRIIMKNGTSHVIADQARREGVKDLRQSGLLKVKQGLTSLEEVEACTNE